MSQLLLLFKLKHSYMMAFLLAMNLLFYSSCTPDAEVETPNYNIASVQILDQLSHKPIENAKVKLIRVDDISWSKAIWTEMETQYSDQDGLVKFSKTYSTGSPNYDNYQIEIYESERYFRNYDFSVEKDKEVLYQEPKSWVSIHVKDLNPNDGMERLIINSFSIYDLYLDLDFNGEQIDKQILFLAHPSDNTEFKIENYKNAEIIKYSIFAPINAFDTVDVDVFFK